MKCVSMSQLVLRVQDLELSKKFYSIILGDVPFQEESHSGEVKHYCALMKSFIFELYPEYYWSSETGNRCDSRTRLGFFVYNYEEVQTSLILAEFALPDIQKKKFQFNAIDPDGRTVVIERAE